MQVHGDGKIWRGWGRAKTNLRDPGMPMEE
jgi:hypothetical protein